MVFPFRKMLAKKFYQHWYKNIDYIYATFISHMLVTHMHIWFLMSKGTHDVFVVVVNFLPIN
jgi:hypothetical protein